MREQLSLLDLPKPSERRDHLFLAIFPDASTASRMLKEYFWILNMME